MWECMSSGNSNQTSLAHNDRRGCIAKGLVGALGLCSLGSALPVGMVLGESFRQWLEAQPQGFVSSLAAA